MNSQNQLSNLILKTLETQNKDWAPKSHYPSSAGFKYSDGTVIGPDILSSFYKWTGVKPSNPSDGPSLMRMKLGDATHGVLGNILSKAGKNVLIETSFKKNVDGLLNPVSGRTDFLLELTPSELEVVEAKSSQDAQMFGKIGNGWTIRDTGPKPDHLLQGICYLKCIPGLKRCRFIYVARDTGRMLEFVMELSGEDSYIVDGRIIPELSWAGIVARWAELERIVKLGVPPAPDYRAWINEKTGDVMDTKQIDGEKFRTPWRVTYDSYRDAIWRNPENFKFSMNATYKK